ncbi:MAG: ATP-dependent Clp protease proteolytic subunit [Candidatus Doudnabacteria bacterium]|nr:ATP-dependent Clp protease proteolytic subunit [Candidatus Doudnabacteria bacterium]
MECYIVFEGGINAENYKKLAETIFAINKDTTISKINIFLSSYGGSTYYGFALATIIQNSKIPISIHATNHIDSIANVVFLSPKAENRTSESHAKFFVHGASRNGDYDERALNEALSAIKAENHRIATFISENSRLPLDQAREKMKNGETMSATEALSFGYINQLDHKTVPLDTKRYDIISTD